MTSPLVRFRRLSGETIEQLAERGATGALHCESGTVHFADGWVVNVESAHTPGMAGALAACGRIPAEVWQETVRTFGPDCRVGRALVDQGRLTRGELELCHLAALYDAAYFVLPARSTTSWFESGARHWLGPVRPVSVHRLRRETLRRRSLLERIWPCPQLDTAPVVGARGGRTGGRATTARQRELLAHVDGLRTPLDLARLLGRPAFATTADVRRLAAAGLVATPPGGAAPATVDRPVGGRTAPAADVDADTVEFTLAGLERRSPGAALAALPGGAAARRRGEPRPCADPRTQRPTRCPSPTRTSPC